MSNKKQSKAGSRSSKRKKRSRCQRINNLDGSYTIKLNERASSALKQQLQSFKDTFGRDPEPKEPIFFDPKYTDKPRPYTEESMGELWQDFIEAAGKAGIDPAMLYAMEQTERIVTAENAHLLTEAELAEWDEAIAEYRRNN